MQLPPIDPYFRMVIGQQLLLQLVLLQLFELLLQHSSPVMVELHLIEKYIKQLDQLVLLDKMDKTDKMEQMVKKEILEMEFLQLLKLEHLD